MSFGLSNVANMYYQKYANQQKNAVNRSSSVDFSNTLSAKKTENISTVQ